MVVGANVAGASGDLSEAQRLFGEALRIAQRLSAQSVSIIHAEMLSMVSSAPFAADSPPYLAGPPHKVALRQLFFSHQSPLTNRISNNFLMLGRAEKSG